jgi:hypothetical protein
MGVSAAERTWEAERGEPADSDEVEPDDGAESGDIMAQLLLSMLFNGKMSAKNVCIVSYWAQKKGAQGKVCELAQNPCSPSGHFQRRLDSVLGFNVKVMRRTYYHVDMPCLRKCDLSRSVHPMPVQAPHECLHKEVLENPGLLDEVKVAVEQGQMPRSYSRHPVVRANTSVTVPLALYVDGINMTRLDSILGFFIYSIATRKRHVIADFRKSTLCK